MLSLSFLRFLGRMGLLLESSDSMIFSLVADACIGKTYGRWPRPEKVQLAHQAAKGAKGDKALDREINLLVAVFRDMAGLQLYLLVTDLGCQGYK
jgi:hypothetical protein